MEENDEPHGPLVPLSEEAAAFLETTFASKLDNATRVSKAKGHGIPDSRWIRCPKMDSVVSTNVSAGARTADRAASRLQQFWLDAVNPLIFVLEKAEEWELSAEVINKIQTALQLMGNANYHHSTARRNALMLQLNPKLKQLFKEEDFKNAAPFLFGESFGPLAKERLEAAAALKRATFTEKGDQQQGFQKGHSQKGQGRGGGSQYNGYNRGSRGWHAPGNKARKGQPKK